MLPCVAFAQVCGWPVRGHPRGNDAKQLEPGLPTAPAWSPARPCGLSCLAWPVSLDDRRVDRGQGRLQRTRAANLLEGHAAALADLLAEASGNDSATRECVSRWENGKHIPTPYWRRHLSSVLDRAAAVAKTGRAAAKAAAITRRALPHPRPVLGGHSRATGEASTTRRSTMNRSGRTRCGSIQTLSRRTMPTG
jgi:hypothetical protein